MGILKTFGDWLFMPPAFEAKTGGIVQHAAPLRSADSIRADVAANYDPTMAHYVSAVYACARVIAEGLALPPCYLHRVGPTGKTLAIDHPLYSLLNQSPNDFQTSYEFRDYLGWQLAINSNAFVWVNRVGGRIKEMIPLEPGWVSIVDPVNLGDAPTYYLQGQPMAPGAIWHLKGPPMRPWSGSSTVQAARNAIALAAATEQFGANLFTNGARPGGILAPKSGDTLTAEQADQVRAAWAASAQGVGNAHKTVLLTAGLDYSPMSSTANEAQWTEARRFAIEEVCRFFRVSPIKVFQSVGSQSYASVEQAHIAHDQDTDAHWQERFVQSANKALLTDADRRKGLAVAIDNRSILRGTATDRVAYYRDMIASGIMTRNEAREMEGFDRSDDVTADELTPAANLFGPAQASDPTAKDTPAE